MTLGKYVKKRMFENRDSSIRMMGLSMLLLLEKKSKRVAAGTIHR
jgi:hypothetical protein